MTQLTSEILRQKIKSLPPLNPIVQKLLHILSDKNSSVEEITQILSSDPSIVQKVLELVNSSFYGFPRRISTISRAVIILGNKSIQNLVLAFASLDSFKDYQGPISKTVFWVHSLTTAAIAQTLAGAVKYPVPEEAFIAGLLHDIGQLILSYAFPSEYKNVLQESQTINTDREIEEFSMTHADAGALLLESWNLPETLCDVVKNHHSPLQPSLENLHEIIKLANILSILLGEKGLSDLKNISADSILHHSVLQNIDLSEVLKQSENLVKATIANLIPDHQEKSQVDVIEKSEMETIAVFSKNPLYSNWLENILSYMGIHTVFHDYFPLKETDTTISHSLVLSSGYPQGELRELISYLSKNGVYAAIYLPSSQKYSCYNVQKRILPFLFNSEDIELFIKSGYKNLQEPE